MKICILNSDELLIASAKSKAQRVDDGRLSSIVLSDQCSELRPKGDDQRLIGVAEHPEVFDSQFRKVHG